DKCPHCGGTGHVRSVASLSLQLLRVIEETLLRGATHDLIVRTNSEVALYILNHKRSHLRDLEQRFRIKITVSADATLGGQQPFIVEKGEQVHSPEQARVIAAEPFGEPAPEEPEDEDDVLPPEEQAAEGGLAEHEVTHDGGEEMPAGEEPREGGVRRRRRRRRRGGRHEDRPPMSAEHEGAGDRFSGDDEAPQPMDEGAAELAEHAEAGEPGGEGEHGENGEPRRRRRRGRRGGRRNRRGLDERGNGHERDDGHAPMADSATAEEIVEHVPGQRREIEPEVRAAVSDFGGPPAPREEAHEAPAPAQAETPRRRSTIRERVSFGAANEADQAPTSAPERTASAPQPAAESPAADQPRKTGWWAKKILGN